MLYLEYDSLSTSMDLFNSTKSLNKNNISIEKEELLLPE
jgi:hypothetical protein